MKTFSIKVPVYKVEPLFVINCSYAELSKLLKRRYHIELTRQDNQFAGTVLTFTDAPWKVIWIREYNKTPEKQAVLMHELFHWTVGVCHERQIPIKGWLETGECGDEAAAYLFEFICKEVLKKLK